MAELKPMSFELNTDALSILRQEFDVDKLADKFEQATKTGQAASSGKEIFSDYGVKWMKRTLQLGEEYPDRTYELLKETIDHLNGYLKFSLLPQRFLEMAYLGILDLRNIPVMENSPRRLDFRIPECRIYDAVLKRCGKTMTDQMYCKHACLSALEVLHKDLELEALIKMEAALPDAGYCEFSANRV